MKYDQFLESGYQAQFDGDECRMFKCLAGPHYFDEDSDLIEGQVCPACIEKYGEEARQDDDCILNLVEMDYD